MLSKFALGTKKSPLGCPVLPLLCGSSFLWATSQQPHPHLHLPSDRCDLSTGVTGCDTCPGSAPFLWVKPRHDQRLTRVRDSSEVPGRV